MHRAPGADGGSTGWGRAKARWGGGGANSGGGGQQRGGGGVNL